MFGMPEVGNFGEPPDFEIQITSIMQPDSINLLTEVTPGNCWNRAVQGVSVSLMLPLIM